MMRWPGLLFIGILAYLLFLLGGLPASLALAWLPENAIPIQVSGVGGTVWSGSAARAVYKRIPLGRIEWDFSPVYLLLGRADFEVALSDSNQEVNGLVTVGILGGHKVESLKGNIQIAPLPALAGYPVINLDGQLDLDLQWLTLSPDNIPSAEGSVRWLNARINKPFKMDLGSVQFDLTPSDQGVQAIFKDQNGPYGITGEASLSSDGIYQVTTKLKPTDKADPSISAAMEKLGKKAADGTIQFVNNGSLLTAKP